VGSEVKSKRHVIPHVCHSQGSIVVVNLAAMVVLNLFESFDQFVKGFVSQETHYR